MRTRSTSRADSRSSAAATPNTLSREVAPSTSRTRLSGTSIALARARRAASVAAPDRGTIAVGQLADLVAWDAEHEGAFAWQLGVVPRWVWKGGRALVSEA